MKARNKLIKFVIFGWFVRIYLQNKTDITSWNLRQVGCNNLLIMWLGPITLRSNNERGDERINTTSFSPLLAEGSIFFFLQRPHSQITPLFTKVTKRGPLHHVITLPCDFPELLNQGKNENLPFVMQPAKLSHHFNYLITGIGIQKGRG